jgi:hypothetical protein
MNDVKVKRAELLARVQANRDAHRDLYLKAREGFRARAIEELDDMLQKARTGDVRLMVGLTPPEDHTADYDRAIDMLEMSQDDIIEVDSETFAQLVRNEWRWFGATTATNSLYASGGKLGGSR